jgi:hypothetical protein
MSRSTAFSTSGPTPSISEQPDPIGNSQPRGGSTGPRTPRGKRRSARNASKHNFFVGRILPEEEELVAFLRKNFIQDLRAQSVLELELVDDLVLNRVQRRRLDQHMVIEFEKATRHKVEGWMEMHEQRRAEIWIRNTLALSGSESISRERLNPEDCAAALDGLRTNIRERGLSPDEDTELLNQLRTANYFVRCTNGVYL